VNENGHGPLSSADAADSRQQIAEIIRRLRHVADQLPVERTPHEDLKILSQTLRELRRAFTVFAPYRAQRKVTIFGSARTPRDAPTYLQAERLGRLMADHGWFVVTGAATGIMEAGHRGAGRDRSMGLNIMLPFEQEANEIIRGDGKLVTMKYFFTRKLMFVKECDAVVCLPGGFGTLDEAFEVLTLLQTGKREPMPLVFLDAPGGTYWTDWLAYIKKHLLATQMIADEDLALLRVTTSVDDTVEEILRFYRVYHSMELVSGRLVLRLMEPLDDARLEAIRRDFADVLADGHFQYELESINGPIAANGSMSAPSAPSGREPTADSRQPMPVARLTFHFNRRSLGRLRQLIDAINA
jgi:uncharacterized protein (TIGR00730 family)